jgi:arginyl-tRNA synthetase
VDGFSDNEKKELYRMIGLGALKYFLLKVEPKKRLLFDPNESIDFQGHTGPFIQYTHARIRSIISKAGVEKPEFNKVEAFTATERELIMALNRYPEALTSAARDYSPAQVANYIYELAKLYNKFYHEEPILKLDNEELKNFRLSLSLTTGSIIKRGMRLMGIEVPERM